MDEIWKDVVGYENMYRVSNFGKVESLDRNIINKNGTVIFRKGKCIKLLLDHRGYLRAALAKNNECKRFRVHRLVAIAFIRPGEEKEQVNHVDSNKTNNHLSNLEWCTRQENMNHAVTNGLLDKRKSIGINSKHCSKGIKQFSISGEFIKEYPSAAEAERRSGIHNANILKVANKKRKNAGGFIWEFCD